MVVAIIIVVVVIHTSASSSSQNGNGITLRPKDQRWVSMSPASATFHNEDKASHNTKTKHLTLKR